MEKYFTGKQTAENYVMKVMKIKVVKVEVIKTF